MAARLWHKAPFIRLLAAFAGGIIVSWYLHFSLLIILISLGFSLALTIAYAITPLATRYRFRTISGISLFLLVASLGSLVTWLQDVRNHPLWFGHRYHNDDFVLVKLEEPVVEKTASYKAIASVVAVYKKKQVQQTQGEIILYLKKDSSISQLQYGSHLLLKKNLQEIKNAGNPGSFDYKTYSLFQGITHQVYVTEQDYVVLPANGQNRFKEFVFNSRFWVVATMKNFINGEKEEGLAEALLIGYKDDLDKNLVQAYSNTGVVHIIAISGLHLGLIYGLLVLLTRPMKKIKRLRWLRFFLIIGSLWLFSLIAGAGPSVLRSAVMFSLIAIGETALKKTNIFNTLAFSAFGLLCYNPFWLWDVGFQLSYAAVLSIVLFYQPVYRWFHFPNKLVDFFWKLLAITIAAQILTLPISIYHFHQMPVLFLVANLVAVPLSSLILFGQILLCLLSFLPLPARLLGDVLTALISFMNSYIEGIDRMPFAVWSQLSITIMQTILLLAFSLFFCYWLLEKRRLYAWTAFSCFAFFMLARGISFFDAYRQKKLVVYNVPKHPAMDIIKGRSYIYLGDSALLYDGFERNFHLQPSRILHRISPEGGTVQRKDFLLEGKQFLMLDTALTFAAITPKQTVDVLILSKNPKLSIAGLLDAFTIREIVADGSVPPWKTAQWQKECDSLNIPFYDVSQKGAFVRSW